MKKLLLVLVPAVLLLTSCLDNDNDYTADPVEVDFYNTFIFMNNHGRNIMGVVDEFIDMYKSNSLMEGVTVSDVVDGEYTITANFSNINANSDEKYNYSGLLTAKVKESTTANINGESINIDIKDLKLKDGSGRVYPYSGSISVVDDVDQSTSNLRVRDVSYNDLAILSEDGSLTGWTMKFTYQYSQDGISTPKDSSDDTYVWSMGEASGEHSNYGIFFVRITSAIVKKAALSYVSNGKYSFSVDNIDGGKSFTAEYGAGGNGTIVITTTTNQAYKYPQSSY